MKRMNKSLVLIAIASVMFTSCDQKKKELKEQVDKFNKACPMSLGDIMTLNSAILEDDNTVEMKFTANEALASITALNNHKEDALEIMSMSLTKETSKVLVDKIINAGANLRTVIVGGQSGMRAVFEVTADDLEKAKEKYSNMTEGQKLITSNVLGMKLKLPVRIDDITTMTGLSITSSALVYKYEINDSEIGSDIKQFSGLMKNITMSQMSAQIAQSGFVGERNKQFFQALVDCGQGVKAEYYERNTGARTSFDISVPEIKDIISGKYQKNAPTMEDWNNLGKAVEELERIFEEDSVEYEEDYAIGD